MQRAAVAYRWTDHAMNVDDTFPQRHLHAGAPFSGLGFVLTLHKCDVVRLKDGYTFKIFTNSMFIIYFLIYQT